jgi:hypothetical protein
MSLTNEELAYKYDAMKAKLENDIRNLRNAEAQWREHYIGLYRSHAADNKKLIDTYGIEGEADCWDIIVRQDAALCNMRDRNANLRHQLDDYDQLNAAFENLRMERDELDKSLDDACADLEDRDDRIADLLAENSNLRDRLDDYGDCNCTECVND